MRGDRLGHAARCAVSYTHLNGNVIFIANVGLGKSHLSIALAHTACLRGYPVLFTTAVDIINTLSAAQAQGNLKRELRKYLQPKLLVVDELGYLPICLLYTSRCV